MKSGLSTGATRLFVYRVFDAPVTDGGSTSVKGHLRFDADEDRAVTLRLATSLIDLDQAKDNLRQEIAVNGNTWTSTSLPHSLLSRGGTLTFDMGPEPSRWGTGESAAPVSITKNDKAPAPRSDAIEGDGALFDNTSSTKASAGTVPLPVPARTRAVQYTLTSSDRTEAPVGWTLQASTDGTAWKTLDKRSGKSFAWDRQTRAFSLPAPRAYGHYRLVLDDTATLAEVELLS